MTIQHNFNLFMNKSVKCPRGGGGEDSHMKGTGILLSVAQVFVFSPLILSKSTSTLNLTSDVLEADEDLYPYSTGNVQ